MCSSYKESFFKKLVIYSLRLYNTCQPICDSILKYKLQISALEASFSPRITFRSNLAHLFIHFGSSALSCTHRHRGRIGRILSEREKRRSRSEIHSRGLRRRRGFSTRSGAGEWVYRRQCIGPINRPVLRFASASLFRAICLESFGSFRYGSLNLLD